MKGNLLIAHGGGPTAVINSSLSGVIREAQWSSAIDRIYAARWGVEGLLKEDLLDLTDLTSLDLERLKETPSSAIGTCRYKVKEEDYQRIVDVLRKHRIRFFFYNGGNDSMDTCLKIARIAGDIQVVGIPKTIDNDLAVTDHCPGFGSAARYYALSVLELGLDVCALNIHVSVIEIMGRNAGWLTASTALAREIGKAEAPHLIYLPERPLDEKRFLSDVKTAWDRRRGIVVAVSEGLVNAEGEPLVKASHKTAVDGFGHTLAGNVSHYLADLISTRLGIRARSEKPGLLGRVSKALCSEVDRGEAFEAGRLAVRKAVEGGGGVMVGFRRIADDPYKVEPLWIDLEEVANREKKVPSEFISPAGNDVTEEFLRYCRPLAGGDWPDYFQLD